MNTLLSVLMSLLIITYFFYFFSSIAFHALRFFTKVITQKDTVLIILMTCFIYSSASLFLLFAHIANVKSYFILAGFITLPELFYKFRYTRLLFNSFKTGLTKKNILKNVFSIALFFGSLAFVWTYYFGGSPLLPPTSCDTSLIHLSIIKMYIQNGGFLNAWWLRGNFLPQFIGSLVLIPTTIALYCKLPFYLVPQLYSSFFIILLWIGINSVLKNILQTSLTMISFLFMPIVMYSLSTYYMDMPATLFFTFYIISLFRWLKENSKTATIQYSIATGVAFSTKPMLGIFIASTGIIMLAIEVAFKADKKSMLNFLQDRLKKAHYLAIPFLICIFVFYFNNYLCTKNFLFPFFIRDHGNGYHWDDGSIKLLSIMISFWIPKFDILNFFKDFAVVFNTQASHFSDIGNMNFTPVVLGLFLLGLYFFKKSSRKNLLSYALLYLAFYLPWYFSSPVNRYIIPGMFLLIFGFSYAVKNSKYKYLFLTFAIATQLYLVKDYFNFYQPVLFPADKTQTDQYYSQIENYTNTSLSKPEVQFMSKLDRLENWMLKNTEPTDIVYTYTCSCYWGNIPRPFIGDWFGLANYGEILNAMNTKTELDFFSKYNIKYILFHAGSNLPNVSEITKNHPECFTKIDEFTDDMISFIKFNSDKKECKTQEVDARMLEIQKKGSKTKYFELPASS